MALVSITRLRVRSVRWLPHFAIHTFRSVGALSRSSGFRGGCLATERGLVFWTVTSWDDLAAMRAFRNEDPHLTAMRGLIDWCNEASYAHFEQATAELPDLGEVHRRMVAVGKLSKVRHPSTLHAAGRTAADPVPQARRTVTPRT